MSIKQKNKGQVYLRHTKHLLTVAPFQAWRGSQPLIAQGLAHLLYMAERQGFEPWVRVAYTRFPGVPLKPLGHLSANRNFVSILFALRGRYKKNRMYKLVYV